MSATGGVETEFKWRVDRGADLEALAAAAGDAPRAVVTQVNHFFDTAGRALGAAGWALRLREEEGRRFLTAKGPKVPPADRETGDDGPTARPEVEVELGVPDAAAILAGRVDPLERLAAEAGGAAGAVQALAGGERPAHVGSFRNRRERVGPVELPVAGGEPVEVVLELDRTEFPGGVVHFEVEVEVDAGDAPAVGRALEGLLRRAGVSGRPAPSKAARFFRALAGEAID